MRKTTLLAQRRWTLVWWTGTWPSWGLVLWQPGDLSILLRFSFEFCLFKFHVWTVTYCCSLTLLNIWLWCSKSLSQCIYLMFVICRFLGLLCSYIIREIPNFPPEAEKPVTSLSKLFLFHLNSKSAVQRFVIAQVVYNLALSNKVLVKRFLVFFYCIQF